LISFLAKLGYAPRIAVWELTLQCNLSCRHCGSRAGKAREDELTLAEARRLCRELAELGCQHVTLSGGEPLLRKDWALIAETLVDSGVAVGMITNGSLWTPEVATTVKGVGLESIAFSVDGFEPAHDYQRRVPGHWRAVLKAIDHAASTGLRVSVVTTINSRNLRELEALRELLGQHGVLRWQVQFATPTGNLAENRSLVLEPRDVLYAVPLIAGMCQDQRLPKLHPGHNVGYFGEPEEWLRDPQAVVPFWIGCLAGLSVVGIESHGNIKGCLSLPSALNGVDAFVEGNLRASSLRDIWCKEGAFAYCREFRVESLDGFCRTCDYGDICRGGCTWACFAEQGLVRDNAYCYWRQLHQAEAGPVPEKSVHLPVLPG
jgi:radical SAM protein with 4Fe4S-binding SPASM domain